MNNELDFRRNINVGDWVTSQTRVGQIVKELDNKEFWVLWSGHSLAMNELATSLEIANYDGEDLAGTQLPNGKVNRLIYDEYLVQVEVRLDHKKKPQVWSLEKLNHELSQSEKPHSVNPPFNKPTMLSLSQICLDGGTQSRAAINATTVNEYAEDYKNGANFPPITVFYDGEIYWLADGFHREKAAKKAGLTEIAAIVKQGTRRDAVLYSVGANALHGLRRTNADKRRAVITLLEDGEWSGWSDRKIARQCGVSHDFVNRLRKSLSFNDSEKNDTKNNDTQTRTYITKHGTTAQMNTANIGKGKSSDSLPPLAEDKEPTNKSEDKEVTTASSEENNHPSNAPPDNAPVDNAPANIRDLCSEGDRVRIKDNHYFGGQFGIITLIPNRHSAVVEFSPGEREIIQLEDLDLPQSQPQRPEKSEDKEVQSPTSKKENNHTSDAPVDNAPANIRDLCSEGDRVRIKDNHYFGGQFGIITLIPNRYSAVVEFSPGERELIQLKDLDLPHQPKPQRPSKKEIIIKEGLNYKAGWPCKWYVEVEEKTYKGLQEYREKVGTVTLDGAIARFLEEEKDKTPNSDDICLCLTNNLQQLTDDRVQFVVTAIASTRPKIICQVAETVRANYLDKSERNDD